MTLLADTWFRVLPASSTARARLICLPPAGAGIATFASWREFAPPWLELCLAQLPGREVRIAEPPAPDVDALVDGLAAAVGELTASDALPYAVFGHSMGGLLAYELAGRLEAGRGRAPAHVFVSASAVPGPGADELVASGLADPEAFLRRLGGTMAEVWEYPDLVELVTAALRADLTLLRDHRLGAHAIAAPLALLYGNDDPVAGPADVSWWRSRARGPLSVARFAGGHFYLTDDPAPVLAAVVRHLDQPAHPGSG